MGSLGAHFLLTQPGRHKNSIMCAKIVSCVPELNALQNPGFRVWVLRLFVSPFLNEIAKTGKLYKKSSFLKIKLTCDASFGRKCANLGIIRQFVAVAEERSKSWGGRSGF